MSNIQKNPLRIGILLTFEAQMLDLSGIDLFGMTSKQYLEAGLPQSIVDQGLDVTISYIGRNSTNETSTDQSRESPGANLQTLTAQAAIKTNAELQSPAVQPGSIDILFIPGPDPRHKHDEKTLEFVKDHAKHGTTILVVCTGCLVVAEAGILKNRSASGPRGLVPNLRKKYPDARWDDKRRFVKDVVALENGALHELWTSGGITNGLEMVAAYLKEKYPGPMSEAVCAMADVGEKGEFYDTKNSVDTAWWLGQILRALFQGKRR